MSKYRMHILVCGGTGCIASGAEDVVGELRAELTKHNLQDEVQVLKTGCFGLRTLSVN